jgi:hypothetical protein
MMRFGRMPLFSMRTSEELREEGRRLNLERLMSDIINQPIRRPAMETIDGSCPPEERRDRNQ